MEYQTLSSCKKKSNSAEGEKYFNSLKTTD